MYSTDISTKKNKIINNKKITCIRINWTGHDDSLENMREKKTK